MSTVQTQWRRPVRGTANAPVMVVCDAPSREACEMGLPMSASQLKWLGLELAAHGFDPKTEFLVVGLCPPILQRDHKSAARKWKHVEGHVEPLRQIIETNQPRVVVTFGELATRAVLGRAVKITKARGMPVVRDVGPPVYPMLSPGFVDRLPEHLPTFKADVGVLARLKENDWDVAAISDVVAHYEWRTDISDLLGENKPAVISVDTEGTGLRWWDPRVVLLTVQISIGPGHAVVCPVDAKYWSQFGRGERKRILGQLRELLEDPEVRKIAQNLKFDHMMLRKLDVEVQGWLHDTNVMGFAVDENMLSLGLDELVRVFVPSMAGYADEFNRLYDKSNMRAVPHDDYVDEDGKTVPGMLTYAGGDPDATFRLAKVLKSEMAKDPRQQRVYRKIQMPALLAFANVVERYGIRVDLDKLREFGVTLEAWLSEERSALLRMVPVAVRRKHLNSGKALSFTRADFVSDTLFSAQGFGLQPVVFTDSTQDLDPSERVPSTSTKNHFPYFVNDPRRIVGHDETVGGFVTRLIEFQKTTKLFGTYVGKESDPKKDGAPTGFWKYLSPDGRIHPSYGVSFVNTGRTNSRDPNGQNFPKRGRWAKEYQKIFLPTPGYKFVAADLSQIELRIAAWMAMEPTMLSIYRQGGDIHSATAAAVLGVTYEQFMSWKRNDQLLLEVANSILGSGDFLRKLNPGKCREATLGDYYNQKRFEAKAVNFGFLYGMGWRKFRIYAKTDYGVDFTEEEAQDIRRAFFDKYPGLRRWHDTMKTFARRNGYVRALHGSCRHLPSVRSSDEGTRAQAERFAVNSPVQRFGSDLGLIGLIRFCHQADPERMRILGFIHDQLIMEVREDCVDEGAAALKWCMENSPLQEWFGITAPLPIVSEVEVGDDGGSMEEMEHIEAIKPDWWDDDEDAAAARFYAMRRGSGVAVAA